MLEKGDVVTWQGEAYFVVEVKVRDTGYLHLLKPAAFADLSLGRHAIWGAEIELPRPPSPLKRPAFTEEHPQHVLEDFAERASACENRLSELRAQLARADDVTAEAARAAADAAAAARPAAPAPTRVSQPLAAPCPPTQEPCGDSEQRSPTVGGRKKKSNFTRLMGQMGEDVSWMDDSDSDDGPIYPFP